MSSFRSKYRKAFFVFSLLFIFLHSKSQTFYYSKSTGDLNVLGTWGLSTNGSGAPPANFTTAGRVYIITNRAAATISAAWTVSGAGSLVQVGDGTTGVEFTVPAGFAFNGTVDVANTASLSLLNATNPAIGTLSSGSTVNYANTASQTVLNAAYYNLTLSGSGQKSLANTVSTSISNLLNIDAGVTFRLHTVNTLSTTLSGSITGAGAILGNANSNLIITGAGNTGILTLTTTTTLNQLIFDRISSGLIALGSNLTVSNNFTHINGNLDLNGNLLTLNGSVTFPATPGNGAFIGSNTSSVTIGAGASAITNSLFMDQSSASASSLSRLGFNRIGETLTLGNNLIVENNFVQTNGIVDLNGMLLSISGIITFPASITNGAFTGSPTSSLSIGGTGAITNSLKMDQSNAATRTLHAFTVDHPGATVTLGNNLVCAGAFIHNNGPISIGATLLTLDGAVTFPLAAANGNFIGSATSSISIGGAGAISNPMFMRQTNTAGRTFNSFTINRTGQTLALGNPLVVNTFNHTSGTINLNGTLLTLNRAITFPSTIANGAFIGSNTSSVVIGTSTSTITNSFLMDQNNTGTRSLSQFSINRTGQTLFLGNNLIVENNFVQTNSIIDLNGASLSISGIITFPAAIANGAFSGSATSSLSIGGSGTITNSLKMDQTNTSTRTLHAFTVDHTGGTVTLGNDLICSGAFIHNNGPISIGATLLTLEGAVTFPLAATNGSITGSATSSISIGGAGAISNALFMSQASTAARTFNSFTINRAGQTLALGNPLIVNTFNQTNCTIDLNGTLLTLNGAITFPSTIANGAFIGSNTSSVVIGTSASTITNSFLIDQNNTGTRSLSQFSISRTGQTLFLGNNLIVENNFVQTNGIIDLNGTLLSISGIITFPAAIANGAFSGSATSSLSIGGSGTITNSLKMDQTNTSSRTLHAFTVDHTGGTVALGNNLTCAGAFIHNNGPISIGATLLTLEGAVTFPLAATNGSITGSATSSISIGGAGAISNALFMSQASAVARTFNSFTLNRAGQTLALGNPLIVNTFNQTNGTIDLNGTLLTLNSVITFPATISNGAFIGSNTSSLSIAGTGAITNTLKMDQGNSSNRSLYDLTLSRTGQTLNIGNALEIRNSVTPTLGSIITGGLVTLKSDAVRSAMVGVVGGSISGNINVETFLPGGFTGWANLGPAGVTGLTVANWEGQIHMSCIGCPNDEYSAGSYFVSIQRFNETGVGTAAYVPLSYSSGLTRGNGYWVYVGTGTSTTSAINYSVSGPAVTGNVLIPLTVSANSGYNLVANPYPAPIDWDLVTADAANSNVSGAIYFYNADLGVNVSYAAGLSNPSGYITNGIIPMGQGFCVQANAGTNLTFRESHKSNQNTSANPVLKTQSLNSLSTVFRLSITGSYNDYDETAFRFHPDATLSYDQSLDARKIFQTPGYLGAPGIYSKYTTISSRMGNEDYSINSLPDNQSAPVSIPVLVKVMSTGTFVISPVDIQNLPANSCVMLKDKLLNIDHDLRSGSYVCDISDTLSTPRFELTICNVSTSINKLSKSVNSVMIGQDAGSTVYINTKFDKNVTSAISAYNILGQKITDDIEINGAENSVKLELAAYANQIVIIKVTNDLGVTTQKVLVH